MAFTVIPFADILAMTKEKLDAALAPIRARSVRAKAEMAQSKLEERMVTLEREILEACATKEVDFDDIISKMDKYELAERKVNQINALIAGMFPEKA